MYVLYFNDESEQNKKTQKKSDGYIQYVDCKETKKKKNGKSKITFLDYKTYRFDKNLADGRSFFDWFVNIHRIR